MHIVTVCTHNDGWFDALRVSCERNQCQLSVLGWGHQWKGLTWKFLLMKQFLNQCQNDNEILVFVDAFDVIVLEPSHIIHERFCSLTRNGSRILLGVENPMRWHITEVMKTSSQNQLWELHRAMAFPNCGRYIMSSKAQTMSFGSTKHRSIHGSGASLATIVGHGVVTTKQPILAHEGVSVRMRSNHR